MLKWLKKGTWWRHLILLAPVEYYAIYTETIAEKIMIGGATLVVMLMIEKVYELPQKEKSKGRADFDDVDPGEVIPSPLP